MPQSLEVSGKSDDEATAVKGFIEEKEKEDTAPREKWSRQLDFIFACVGLSIGIGNLWRFPYLCYKNGGGAFLIPFLTFIILGGVPIYILELGLGQYMSFSGFKAWAICPVFQGVALSNVVTGLLANLYYIMVLAWAAYYFALSLTSVLPWSSCNNDWNTPRCLPFNAVVNNSITSTSLVNNSIRNSQVVDPAVEFWEREVLQLTSDITDGGGIVWQLALSLLVVWVLVYFSVWRGVQWTGKVVYFTALFPYVILAILLVRGLTLDGAPDGIIYYLKPDWSRLADIQVWMDGGTQVFFSYAVAVNAHITLGSYNKFTNNFYRQAILVSCLNSGTSLIGGFAVFSVLGFMAKQHNIPIDDVANAGPGLAFITYPNAVTQMALSPLWASLFFLMIVFLGLDSQFVAVEAIISSIIDCFPRQMRNKKRRMVFVAVYCFISYLIGLSMASRGGMYIFQLFDYYSCSGMVMLWIVFFELVAIGWGFGADRFYDAIELMIGSRINPYLYICWKYLSPLLCMGLLLAKIISFQPLKYNRTYEYPDWAQGFGLLLSISSMVCIPVYAIFKMSTANGSLSQRWKRVTSPVLQKHQIHSKWRVNIARNE